MTNELSAIIAQASREAFSRLFASVDEEFYYCTLVTTGEALPPQISAWSWEALNRVAEGKSKPEMWRSMLKWSYADSPYVDFGSEFFKPVYEAFEARPSMTTGMIADEWDREFSFRLNAMTEAMKTLSDEGIFGTGEARAAKIVLVEVVPPDASNAERARLLNREGPALANWIEEAGEE